MKIFDKAWSKLSSTKESRLSLGNSEIEIGKGFEGAIRKVVLMRKVYDNDQDI
jgi:hypothetical protein